MIGPLVLVGLLSGGDCLSRGVEAARDRRWDDAFRALRAARARPACDTPVLLFNLARAGEKLVESGEERLACEIAELYAEFMATRPKPAMARLSIEGRAKMARICAEQVPVLPPRPDPEPSPAPSTSNALEWGLTTGAFVTAVGAGLTYALALGRIDERDAARDAFVAAGVQGDAIALADARLDFERHRDAARTLGVTSYALAGTAAILTGLAVWAWVSEDAPPGGLSLGPGGVGWGGRF